MSFTEFSTDALVGLPPELFTEVIPAITQPSELKVTLHTFYCLIRQRRTPRRMSWDELTADTLLRKSLRALSSLRAPEDLLEEGLSAAVQRGTLLHLAQPTDGRVVNWYLAHTASNRRWIEQGRLAGVLATPDPSEPHQRPPLLTLYEENIGIITPLLIDELRMAHERYPEEWIEEAIREAVRANARNWRYIRKILERWETHGRTDASHISERHRPIDVDKYTGGALGGFFRAGGRTSEC